MTMVLAIGAGGAIGSLLRYGMSLAVYQLLGRQFPWVTLSVNIVGSFIMGFLFIWLLERTHYGPELRAFLLIGLLGAFTTFSTFSVETLNLMEQGDMAKAGLNIILSVGLCLGGSFAGMLLGRQL